MMKGRRGGCRVDVLIVWTAVHVDVAKISGAYGTPFGTKALRPEPGGSVPRVGGSGARVAG
jgi:hypothetical protein